MNYNDYWDLTTIPDDRLRSEWARRNAMRRETYGGGRPAKVQPCPRCNVRLSARERRSHKC